MDKRRMDKRTDYLSYLLRLWQAPGRGDPRWLASLEVPGTGERQGFTSLQALFSYLESQAGGETGGQRDGRTGRPGDGQTRAGGMGREGGGEDSQ